MKPLLLLLLSACVALGAAGDYTVRDDLTVILEDAKGNLIVAGRLIDHMKISPAKTQAAINSTLAAKADAAPLAARPLVDTAKAAGATVEKATEDKVKAAETIKAEADAAAAAAAAALEDK